MAIFLIRWVKMWYWNQSGFLLWRLDNVVPRKLKSYRHELHCTPLLPSSLGYQLRLACFVVAGLRPVLWCPNIYRASFILWVHVCACVCVQVLTCVHVYGGQRSTSAVFSQELSSVHWKHCPGAHGAGWAASGIWLSRAEIKMHAAMPA